MVALATEGPRCWNEVRIPSKSWQGKETADSSGLNFTPTSARTALVGGPGSPLPMNKSMLAPEEQRVHSRTLSLGDAGGFPCARGGAALLAQRCSRRTALPCAA